MLHRGWIKSEFLNVSNDFGSKLSKHNLFRECPFVHCLNYIWFKIVHDGKADFRGWRSIPRTRIRFTSSHGSVHPNTLLSILNQMVRYDIFVPGLVSMSQCFTSPNKILGRFHLQQIWLFRWCVKQIPPLVGTFSNPCCIPRVFKKSKPLHCSKHLRFNQESGRSCVTSVTFPGHVRF